MWALCCAALCRCKVEVSTFCQEIIAARVADGSIPKAPIYSDICAFHPTADMQKECTGFTLGFPCQDTFLEIMLIGAVMFLSTIIVFWLCCFPDSSVLSLSHCFLTKGICKAGCMRGLLDDRSGLIRMVWKLMDSMKPSLTFDWICIENSN